MYKIYRLLAGRLCFLLPLACLGLFTGCAENLEPEPDKPTTLLLKTARIGNEPTREYVFNRDGKLTRILTQGDTTLHRVEYFYDAQGRFSIQKDSPYTIVGEYNAQSQLEKHVVEMSIGGVSEFHFYQHTYNTQGQLIETTYHSEQEPAYVQYRFKYFYEKGVNTRIEKTMYAGDDAYIEDIYITYDSKKQPTPPMPLMGVTPLFRETPLIEGNAGNVLDYLIVNRSDGSKNRTSYKITYVYNDQGYPIEALKESGYYTAKTTYTYTYQ
ncbi:hypothetical protein GU926_05170 [Nibribacter ruber]|uniref:DUF4595 domain-containing protein n=1 Tax=Nibribacter ruber TaxID=2698458 RepID=A0A6P1NUX8_9BACT|nr:hypothetical protein [Nibribacter ruber]QHL86860.1 hypothetical protein GU926_05170 [Nibribacter ruber]